MTRDQQHSDIGMPVRGTVWGAVAWLGRFASESREAETSRRCIFCAHRTVLSRPALLGERLNHTPGSICVYGDSIRHGARLEEPLAALGITECTTKPSNAGVH